MKAIEKRPSTVSEGSTCTTPHAAQLIALLGGISHKSVAISEDERRALERLYGFEREVPRTKPNVPPAPKREDFALDFTGSNKFSDAMRAHEMRIKALDKWTDPRPFFQAGADISLMRYAERDGLRLIAWLAKHLEPGADPLKTLVYLAAADGWDVDPEDVEWAQGTGEGDDHD
jgi:hypothetical protein